MFSLFCSLLPGVGGVSRSRRARGFNSLPARGFTQDPGFAFLLGPFCLQQRARGRAHSGQGGAQARGAIASSSRSSSQACACLPMGSDYAQVESTCGRALVVVACNPCMAPPTPSIHGVAMLLGGAAKITQCCLRYSVKHTHAGSLNESPADTTHPTEPAFGSFHPAYHPLQALYGALRVKGCHSQQ